MQAVATIGLDNASLEVAIDCLAERFGTNVVYRADELNSPLGMRLAPTSSMTARTISY